MKTPMQQKVRNIAESVIDGNIDPIQACRELTDLYETGQYPEDIFLTIKGIESETDNFPVGLERQKWDSHSLSIKDEEKEKYLSENRELIKGLCRRILDFLS